MSEKYLASVCCSAGTYIEMSPDFIGEKPEDMTIGTANYSCEECGEACDTKVAFNEEAVKAYFDRAIQYWRSRGKKDSKDFDYISVVTAAHYVDAYQSMRMSLFGELLPEEEEITIPNPHPPI